MRGTFPSQMCELSKLRDLNFLPELDLSIHPGYVMEGTIPSCIGNLTSLQSLTLQVNGFSGTIPDSISGWTQLEHMALIQHKTEFPSPTHLTGTLPAGFDRLVRLKTLFLDGTQLQGISPYSRFKWQQLEDIYFNECPELEIDLHWLLGEWNGLVSIHSTARMIGGLGWLSFQPNLTSISFLDEARFNGGWPSTFWGNSLSIEHINVIFPSVYLDITSDVGKLRNLIFLSITDAIIGWPLPEAISECKKLTTISLQRTRLPGPLPSTIGLLPNLEGLTITDAFRLGPLPQSLGESKSLKTLMISGSGLTGSIPSSLASSASLSVLDLSKNSMQGQIPDMLCEQCLLSENNFSGTIPPHMAKYAAWIDVSHNSLGPSLPSSFGLGLDPDSDLQVTLSHNLFDAPLPQVSHAFNATNATCALSMSNNQFYGTIPASYAHCDLDLSNNRLTGFLDQLFASYTGTLLQLDDNDFEGTIPPLIAMNHLTRLHLARNRFGGTLPTVPPNLLELDLSQNQFSTPLSGEFITSVRDSHLDKLDLGSNSITCPPSPFVPADLLGSRIRHLSLSRNGFSCNFLDRKTERFELVTGLDLSGNRFSDAGWIRSFPSLVVLNLAKNMFSSAIALDNIKTPSLTQADISGNGFSGNIADFANLPYLVSLNVADNTFFGSLKLQGMPNLQSYDVSSNRLDVVPDFKSIGNHFRNHSLLRLSIEECRMIPPMSGLKTEETGLVRLPLSSSAKQFKGVTCFEVGFFNLTGRTFEFYLELFKFAQCDCDSQNFGMPPYHCHRCPSSSSPPLRVNLETPTSSSTSSNGKEEKPVICGGDVFSSPENEFVMALAVPSNDTNGAYRLQTESCLYTPQQIITAKSNCGGITLKANSFSRLNLSMALVALESQCRNGSEGRLCSKCVCESKSECWFDQGASLCVKCSKVFRPSQSAPLFAALLILAFALLSGLFFLVLRSRRARVIKEWNQFSLFRRLFYRGLYLVSLGNVSILISFVQILIEITHWDVYTIGLLALLNGKTESMGLTCFLPSLLSRPFIALLARLLTPLAAVLLVGATCLTAHALSDYFTKRQISSSKASIRQRVSSVNADPGDSDVNDFEYHDHVPLGSDSEPRSALDAEFFINANDNPNGEWIPLIGHEEQRVLQVDYPSLALFSSVSISAIKFFYFGSALAAHEYLFSSIDRYSGVKYVQNKPWMLYKEADALFYLSIPAVIVFDFIIPVAFVAISWKVRKSFNTPQVQFYFGSLFETFNPKCFWWEIVNIIKKLAIALVFRGIPASSAVQSALAVSIIAGAMLIQVSLQPWRRKIENIFDTISAALLVFALIASRSGAHLSDSASVVYYSMSISTAFIIASVATIGFQTFAGTTPYQKLIAQHLNMGLSEHQDTKLGPSDRPESVFDSDPTSDSEM